MISLLLLLACHPLDTICGEGQHPENGVCVDDEDGGGGDDTGGSETCDGFTPICTPACVYNVSVVPYVVSGAVIYDGGQVPDTSSGVDYIVQMVNLDTEEITQGSYAYNQAWSLVVPPGTYDVYFSLYADPGMLNGTALALNDLVVNADMNQNLTITPHTVGGVVIFNGGQVPDTGSYHDYSIRLVNKNTGETATGNFFYNEAWSLAVTAGTYDVYFDLYEDKGQLAITTLAQKDLAVSADTSVSLTVNSKTVSGAVIYEGGQVPDTSSYQDYLVRMVNTETGESAQAAFFYNEAWSLVVTPGTYDVYFDLYEDRGQLAGSALALEGLTVSSDVIQNLTINAVNVSGAVVYNGGQVPDTSSGSDYRIRMVNTKTEEEISQSFVYNETWSMTVAPGTYDVYFQLYADEGQMAAEVLTLDNLSLSTDTFQNLTITPYTVGGVVTYAGGQVPNTNAGSWADYRVILVDTTTGAENAADFLYNEAWSLSVPAGTYDVYFDLYQDKGQLSGAALAIDDLAISAPTSESIVITPVTVSGIAIYDGGQVPDTPNGADYTVTMSNMDTLEVATESFAYNEAWTLVVTPGVYDLSFRLHGDSTQLSTEVVAGECLEVSSGS